MAGDLVGAALRGARQLCPAAGEGGDREAPPERRRAAAPRVPRGGAAGAPSEPRATAGGDAADPLPSPHAPRAQQSLLLCSVLTGASSWKAAAARGTGRQRRDGTPPREQGKGTRCAGTVTGSVREGFSKKRSGYSLPSREPGEKWTLVFRVQAMRGK